MTVPAIRADEPDQPIVTAFPEPPRLLAYAFDQLAVARFGTDEQRASIPDPAVLPRPWDPPSCPPTLRRELWAWLDDVAAWIGRDCAWHPGNAIPGCWPRHPHLVRELAVLACQRHHAGQALTPDPLEDWHRYALPAFLQRMTAQLNGACHPGRHHDWPARARHHDYTSPAASALRVAAYAADLAP